MFAPSTSIFVALITAAVANAGASCTRHYTVEQGDTCDIISLKNAVSTYQLAAVNVGVIDDICYNLVPGMEVCLATEGEDCTEAYLVVENDTCGAIAESFGMNSTMLMNNNPNINDECSNIYVGEVLCVAHDAIVPAIPENFWLMAEEEHIPDVVYYDEEGEEYEPITPADAEEQGIEDVPFCDDV